MEEATLFKTVYFSPEDITALAWVDCGVLTVAAGNQLRCYLKWLTQKDTVAKRKSLNSILRWE